MAKKRRTAHPRKILCRIQCDYPRSFHEFRLAVPNPKRDAAACLEGVENIRGKCKVLSTTISLAGKKRRR